MQHASRTTTPRCGARARRLTAAAVVALAVAGCGGGGTTTVSDAEAPSGGSEGAGQSTTPVTGTAATTGPPPAERALASRDGSVDDDAVRFEIVSLKRSGSIVNLTARLRTTGSGGATPPSAQLTDALSDGLGNRLEGSGETEELDVFDGVSLIDGTNRKRYLTARDSTGRCVCDTGLSGTFVGPEGPVVLSATFGAPPADVRSVDVRVPTFGTFSDVPLS